ncbi:MAG: c-type cytochrome [Myxococcales bacterium]|nr:c-type cytochrome [Myxococcales bacterium]
MQYRLPDGRTFELANELVLPVDRRTTIELHASDVIHSFWVPSLAGKTDMIPGRVNRMGLEPTRVGEYRGVCAEYCGLSHARMAFRVLVVTEDEYRAWYEHQLTEARTPRGASSASGHIAAGALGCGACHRIRGLGFEGEIGPDLTHVGSRTTVGAMELPNTLEGFERWLEQVDHLKPGAAMPAYDMIDPDRRRELASFLENLK